MNNALPTTLHIEDDPNDVSLLQHACRTAKVSFNLVSVNDGEKAIGYLSGQDVYSDRSRYPLPALVFLDLKMPRQSGFEVLQWVRSHPSLKSLPILILTSSRHDMDVKRAYEMGANTYLVKPVNFEALVTMVKTIDFYWLTLSERLVV